MIFSNQQMNASTLRSKRDLIHGNPGPENWHLGGEGFSFTQPARSGMVYYVFEIRRPQTAGNTMRPGQNNNGNHQRDRDGDIEMTDSDISRTFRRTRR
ncbi:hypothetical protein TBLA_0B06520 [Henningerozyma blattae CBS 6284]|uniref:Uncharacterized protein n=1 Tax=Henningerozyma blattae (strain ATCC 34711 / CBS 6284 / DSM 70876 / NBRC 10599 / NRRL Y-10934 / UCD 77-7) TaxID=1071380 RepID=I2GZC3_HENB6|nr:hypothetical protein TBLA_0B06520 [Tetrapisispora blattae CBS 6284]CCH59475.1 hypothetical protein TBLA_0B06520 [Tetrapisispora blattae CBS 6284]